MGRGLLVIAAALLLAVQVVRNAAVLAFADRSPDCASEIWGSHPNAQIGLGMTEIGRAAYNRKAVPSSVFGLINEASLKAPLAPEPFLVRGVQAQMSGNTDASVKAFLAAEQRDPRSLPARYFLAEHYFRTGDTGRGLLESAALARLAPGGVATAAPYVAAYAEDRRTWPELRKIIAANSDLGFATFEALAHDAGNVDAILALADEQHRIPTASWVPIMLGSLVQAGQYARARSLWSEISGVRVQAGQNVYDADFGDAKSPPPFNWELMSSAVGLAERQSGGRLHVIFYGQQDGQLAKQLLILPVGPYRMTATISGSTDRGRSLTWSLRCDRVQSPFAAITLDLLAKRPWTFTVPAGCGAQWLELSGVSSDVAQQSDFTISGLKLVSERPNG